MHNERRKYRLRKRVAAGGQRDGARGRQDHSQDHDQPRNRDSQVAQIAGDPRDQDVYLSPGDAGRFFDSCVKADRPHGSFDVVYATSIPKHMVRFDLEPAKRLVGFEPKETWPDGVTIPDVVSSSASS